MCSDKTYQWRQCNVYRQFNINSESVQYWENLGQNIIENINQVSYGLNTSDLKYDHEGQFILSMNDHVICSWRNMKSVHQGSCDLSIKNHVICPWRIMSFVLKDHVKCPWRILWSVHEGSYDLSICPFMYHVIFTIILPSLVYLI